MRFAQPEWLWLLLLWMVLGWLALRRIRQVRQQQQSLADDNLWPLLQLDSYARQAFFKRWIWVWLAIICWTIALANPQWGTRMREMQVSNTNLILALDISESMRAQDVRPSRLERAQNFLLDVLAQLENERVALLLFAGDAYLQVPFTTDYGAMRQMIQGANPSQVGTQGTQVAEVIQLAGRVLLPKEEEVVPDASRYAMLIVSDGENHEDRAQQAAAEAIQKGLQIHTAGVGTAEGGYIPLSDGNLKRAQDGTPVLSQFDPAFLQKLAQTGNGRYYALSNSTMAAAGSIAQMMKQGGESSEKELFVSKASYYQAFVLLGLLALAIAWYVGRKHPSDV